MTGWLRNSCNWNAELRAAGRDSIDHPPDAHDDVANAAAGALVTAAKATVRLPGTRPIIHQSSGRYTPLTQTWQ